MSSTPPSSTNPLADVIPTEQRNPKTENIDLLPTEEVLKLMNAEDALVAPAVEKARPQIAVVIDKVTEAIRNGGRVFYVGAGTSGRLGVLDASECPPTFGVAPDLFQGVIAGGDFALRNAVEGAEDNGPQGYEDMKAKIKPGDVVIGLSVSGGAPYVLGAIKAAKELGCFTGGITCNKDSALAKSVDQAMVAEVGPEVIAGSSRMKAGTAQKMILNQISTVSMILVGKTYSNLMVDLMPTNQKLRQRAARYVAGLANTSIESANQALQLTSYKVKQAVLMVKAGLTLEEANAQLQAASGKLRVALRNLNQD